MYFSTPRGTSAESASAVRARCLAARSTLQNRYWLQISTVRPPVDTAGRPRNHRMGCRSRCEVKRQRAHTA